MPLPIKMPKGSLHSRPPLERMLKIHDELRRGAFIRATAWSAEAGGKGINVARVGGRLAHEYSAPKKKVLRAKILVQ